MSERAVNRWADRFRAEAEADGYRLLRRHLRRLKAPGTPQQLVDATITIVEMSRAYSTIDNTLGHFSELLAKQTYDPTDAPGGRYVLTFGIANRFSARAVLGELKEIDLADLNGVMWWEHELAGYSCLWITRVDGKRLSADEVDRLQEDVENDLYFDYTEDELAITAYHYPHYLLVGVAEIFGDECEENEWEEETG